MYNSIEIPDSDDEMASPLESNVIKSINSHTDSSEHTPPKQKRMSVSSTTDAGINKSPGSDTTGGSSPKIINNSSSNTNQTKAQIRHRSRKTQHKVRNATENEIQFETIPLDIEEAMENKAEEEDNMVDIKISIDEMLSTNDVQAAIQRIANERVRCNFLLATYQLPDMNFSLNSELDTLKFQFAERLRLRKERLTVANVVNTS